MGKSLYLPDPALAIEDFGPESVVYDSHSNFYYQPFWRGKEMFIREFRLAPDSSTDTLYLRLEKVDYVIGSGHQTRSYLMERSGYYYEIPITWYVSRKSWALSPGYDNGNNTRFDREIGEDCMACHTGTIDFVKGSENQFRKVSLGIDCEKCHGPGQLHIERMERDEIVDVGEEIDYSIVNPGKLEVQLQFDVCGQCHLQGINVLKNEASVLDFRPGERLKDRFNIFIKQYTPLHNFGIASHGERLRQSRCFMGSGEQLTCITCHNPHESIHVTEASIYTQQCLNCHSDADAVMCGASADLRAVEKDNCITCHMAKGGTRDIPHVTFTDHKIRVLGDTAQTEEVRRFLRLVCMTDSYPSPDLAGQAYLLYFEREAAGPSILDSALQLLAADTYFARAKAEHYAGRNAAALRSIDAAIAAEPADVWRQFKKGEILEALSRPADALKLYEQAYSARPDLLQAGLKVGILTLRLATERGPALEKVRKIFSDCLKRKPFDHQLLANLGFVEMNSGNFSAAHELFSKALSYQPDYLLALENMVILQLQKSDKVAARNYFDQLLAAHPNYAKRSVLEAMFE